jgi:hypothetical protein
MVVRFNIYDKKKPLAHLCFYIYKILVRYRPKFKRSQKRIFYFGSFLTKDKIFLYKILLLKHYKGDLLEVSKLNFYDLTKFSFYLLDVSYFLDLTFFLEKKRCFFFLKRILNLEVILK